MSAQKSAKKESLFKTIRRTLAGPPKQKGKNPKRKGK